MQPPFRLYGAELSPYSIKVRAYLRYKGLAFEWLPRSAARQEEFQRYAKLPLIPVLVDAEGRAMQDSTPIIEALERAFPEPALEPPDAALAFLSALLEDYADEWLNKAMFHYRWTYPADQESAAKRIVDMMFDSAEAPAGLEESVRVRMMGRLHHVGSSLETAPVIEGSFTALIGSIEPMLARRAFLFGGRPCLADFGLYGQLKQLLSDPTPGALLRAQAPNLIAWLNRMETPAGAGDFDGFATLRDELAPLLTDQIAGVYLPWMAANAAAVADDEPFVSVEIAGRTFSQKPQRYAAKAFAELQNKRALVGPHPELDALLGETGCDTFLQRSEANDADQEAAEDGPEEAA